MLNGYSATPCGTTMTLTVILLWHKGDPESFEGMLSGSRGLRSASNMYGKRRKGLF